MMEKRALITGLNGFTGYYLAAELTRAGYTVFGADVKPDGAPNNYAVDLLDKAALRRLVAEVKPTVVVHLAAIAFVGHGNADAFYQVNVIGTRNLLEALAIEAPAVRCVLLPSSATIYGNAAAGVCIDYYGLAEQAWRGAASGGSSTLAGAGAGLQPSSPRPAHSNGVRAATTASASSPLAATMTLSP